MNETTPEELISYADLRNRQTGRSTKFLRFLHIDGLAHGIDVFVGVQTEHKKVAAKVLGNSFSGTSGCASRAIGVDVVGPVLIHDRLIEIVYPKPLAIAFATFGGVLFLKKVSGALDMHTWKIRNGSFVATSPDRTELEQTAKMNDIPLRVCLGDRVGKVSEQLKGQVAAGTISVEIMAASDDDEFSAIDGINVLQLADKWM